jgi:hypothetical protein
MNPVAGPDRSGEEAEAAVHRTACSMSWRFNRSSGFSLIAAFDVITADDVTEAARA